MCVVGGGGVDMLPHIELCVCGGVEWTCFLILNCVCGGGVGVGGGHASSY